MAAVPASAPPNSFHFHVSSPAPPSELAFLGTHHTSFVFPSAPSDQFTFYSNLHPPRHPFTSHALSLSPQHIWPTHPLLTLMLSPLPPLLPLRKHSLFPLTPHLGPTQFHLPLLTSFPTQTQSLPFIPLPPSLNSLSNPRPKIDQGPTPWLWAPSPAHLLHPRLFSPPSHPISPFAASTTYPSLHPAPRLPSWRLFPLYHLPRRVALWIHLVALKTCLSMIAPCPFGPYTLSLIGPPALEPLLLTTLLPPSHLPPVVSGSQMMASLCDHSGSFFPHPPPSGPGSLPITCSASLKSNSARPVLPSPDLLLPSPPLFGYSSRSSHPEPQSFTPPHFVLPDRLPQTYLHPLSSSISHISPFTIPSALTSTPLDFVLTPGRHTTSDPSSSILCSSISTSHSPNLKTIKQRARSLLPVL